MPALGTHVAITEKEKDLMFGDIPMEKFITHDWRNDVIKLGEVPASYMSEITEGIWNKSVDIEINKIVMDPSYDLILSIGQVVPHEVVGMSNHAKNLFVGCGGKATIDASHMVGAFYGLERMMGKDKTPVRKLFDYGFEHFLANRPIDFILTVTTNNDNVLKTHGLFIGPTRDGFEEAVKLAQEKNIILLDKPLKKVVVNLDEIEFKSTWLGNKSVYRTRMAIADDGELIVLAPGVDKFGEDGGIDKLIRKYGYKGRLNTIKSFNENEDLQKNMSAAAHLIHGSSDGRFSISYAVKAISKEEINSVGYIALDYEETAKKYHLSELVPGFNKIDGEEIYYIPNPALGLWAWKDKIKD